MRIDLSSIEEYVAGHLRLFIVSVAGLLLFVGIIAVSVFFIAVRGAEKTMVPDVTGKELTEALLELQVKELYPRLQLRYSQSSRDKGNILEQEPKPGTIVKAGRRIRLVVSQGVVVNKVENFISRNIEEVRMDLLSLQTVAGGSPLLSIKEPLMYEFSSETPGTILAQKPEYGADIFGPLTLEFVVSKGRENLTVVVPQFTGVQFTRALELISGTGINYHFTSRAKTGDESAETVVYQNPTANTAIPLNNVVQLIVTYPDRLADNERFGVFNYPIPQNPYPLAVRLDALLPSGERQRLLAVNYMGGNFTVPYKQPVGTVLILTMMNRELYRATVN
ncbi:MAG: PASTA domain-containing protein [Treponema sp.]|jgi:beta-lactam-binding protein with PASTA domain|nr:PASTA domain-containing protein [Treponema sp.]